jgi:hypothetical protein
VLESFALAALELSIGFLTGIIPVLLWPTP